MDTRGTGPKIRYLKLMRLTQDLGLGINLIRSYAAGEIRINDRLIQCAVMLSATQFLLEPAIRSVADLADEHAARILGLDPEIVLLGSGRQQCFPAASFGAQFMRAGIGFEVMDTGAACRTFNVLAAEQRRVVALLLV